MAKKWTALLLALVLCGSLAACSGGNQNAEDTVKEDQAMETVKPEDEKDKQETADKEDAAADKTESAETDKGGSNASSGSASTGSAGTGSSTAGSTSSGNTSSSAAGTVTKPSTGNSAASKPQTPAPAPAPEPAPAPQPEPEPESEPAGPTAAQASAYIGGSASALEGALGSPSSKSYSPSCMGEGEDGIWSYGSFTVYTYRENGTETVEAVQ